MDKLLTYKYYDTPEGQDIIFKSFAISKIAAVTGLGLGAYDVLMYSHPQGFINAFGRMAWFVGPLVGAATAFAVTTNAAQNWRGKNDKINYFLGGAVSGLILSAWQKKPIMAVPCAMIFGAAGLVKKTAVDAGYEFFPEIAHATKTIKSVNHDWTMAKDYPQHKTYIVQK